VEGDAHVNDDRLSFRRVLIVGDTRELLQHRMASAMASLGLVSALSEQSEVLGDVLLLRRAFMELPICPGTTLLDQREHSYSPYVPGPKQRPSKRYSRKNKKRAAQKAQRKARLMTKRAAR
jgi:hypothetical protein